MIDLNHFVVPKVYAHWRDVAHALKYKTPIIKGIEAQHQKCPKGSCKGLFEDWLLKDNGIGPKTWSTLLNAIKRTKKLSSKALEEILEEACMAQQ